MAYYLYYTRLADKYLNVPTISIAAGQNYSIEFESFFDDTDFFRPLGRIGDLNSRILLFNTASGNTVRITDGSGSNANFTASYTRTNFNKFKFVRTSGVTELFINDVSVGTSTAASGAFSITHCFVQNNAYSSTGGIKSILVVIGGATSRNYVNSSGTGNVWPDIASGQDATQVGGWPSNDAEWVFYSGGASNTITVSATLPKITGSLTLNEINPSYVISVNGQLPKLTGAVALNEINPVFTVAVAGQLPKLTGSIALNQFANNRQAAVNGVLPKLTGAVTLNRIQPNNQVAVSGQLPRITASITLRVPDSYPAANPNDYTVSAYLSTDSTYTARLSESSTINAIISAETTYAARLN